MERDFGFYPSNKAAWTKWSLKEMTQMVLERFPLLLGIVLGRSLGNIDLLNLVHVLDAYSNMAAHDLRCRSTKRKELGDR